MPSPPTFAALCCAPVCAAILCDPRPSAPFGHTSVVGAAQPEPRSGTHRPNLVRGSGARVGGLRPGRGVRSALASPTGPFASLRDHPAPRTTFRTPCAPNDLQVRRASPVRVLTPSRVCDPVAASPRPTGRITCATMDGARFPPFQETVSLQNSSIFDICKKVTSCAQRKGMS